MICFIFQDEVRLIPRLEILKINLLECSPLQIIIKYLYIVQK